MVKTLTLIPHVFEFHEGLRVKSILLASEVIFVLRKGVYEELMDPVGDSEQSSFSMGDVARNRRVGRRCFA